MEKIGTPGLTIRAAWHNLAVLAVAALLLPFLGPAMDHHFAERQHGHGHVYLGAASAEHQHPYEGPHIHQNDPHLAHGGSVVAVPGNGVPDDIVYLTSYRGLGQELASPLAAPIRPAVIFPDNDPFLFAIARREHILSGVFVAPPENPPRI